MVPVCLMKFYELNVAERSSVPRDDASHGFSYAESSDETVVIEETDSRKGRRARARARAIEIPSFVEGGSAEHLCLLAKEEFS